MKRRPGRHIAADPFEIVRTVGLTLPNVETATKYDGSPVLKAGGCFMAGLATHRSAEPGTLVVRTDVDDRVWLIDDAPETYYVTDYYQNHPVVLVRLSRIDHEALRDLLSVSWRLAMARARRRRHHGSRQNVAGAGTSRARSDTKRSI
jgi:hypothetical protein